MAYVERNPVRAQLAANAEEYEWSTDWIDLTPWQARYDWTRWQEALRSCIDEEAFGQRLREAAAEFRPKWCSAQRYRIAQSPRRL